MRKLAELKGTLDQLLSSADYTKYEDAFVRAVLLDVVAPLDAMARLRERFGFMAEIELGAPVRSEDSHTYRQRIHNRSDQELLLDFYAHVTGENLNSVDSDMLLDMLRPPVDEDEGHASSPVQGVA